MAVSLAGIVEAGATMGTLGAGIVLVEAEGEGRAISREPESAAVPSALGLQEKESAAESNSGNKENAARRLTWGGPSPRAADFPVHPREFFAPARPAERAPPQ